MRARLRRDPSVSVSSVTITREQRIIAIARQLEAAAREARMTITGDGRIGESDAAELLGLEAETLKKRRHEGRAPTAYGLCVGRSRVSYRFADIAHWIEATRETFDSDA